MITDEDKLSCATRELAMRRAVYPNQIRKGLITPSHADREIALMTAIVMDYRAKVQPGLQLGNEENDK
jgi:hypothetical protein